MASRSNLSSLPKLASNSTFSLASSRLSFRLSALVTAPLAYSQTFLAEHPLAFRLHPVAQNYPLPLFLSCLKSKSIISKIQPLQTIATKLHSVTKNALLMGVFCYFRFLMYSARSANFTVSSDSCKRTLTVSASTSFGPTIKMQGIFILVASRIFLPRLSLRRSTR